VEGVPWIQVLQPKFSVHTFYEEYSCAFFFFMEGGSHGCISWQDAFLTQRGVLGARTGDRQLCRE